MVVSSPLGWGQSAPLAVYEGERDVLIELIDVNDGLSQGFTASMQIDRDGYLWIATKEGLNRYDGRNFRVFRHSDADTASLASNFVNYVFIDSQNRVWAATNNGYLDLFDPRTETFIHHKGKRGNQTLKHNVFIWPMSETPDQSIVFPAMAGSIWNLVVSDRNGASGSPKVVDILEKYPALGQLLIPNVSNQALRAMPDGSIWSYCHDTLYYFSKRAIALGLPPKRFLTSLPEDYHLGKKLSSCLILDSKNQLYSISGDSLLLFDPVKEEFQTVLRLPEGHVFRGSAIIDRRDRLWTATSEDKFLQVDLTRKTFVVLRPRGEAMVAKYSSNTYFTAEDNQGNIWLGTNGYGILKISATADRFKAKSIVDIMKVYPDDRYWKHRVVRPGERAVLEQEWIDLWYDNQIWKRLREKGIQLQGMQSQHAVDSAGNFWHGGNQILNDGGLGPPVIIRTNPKTLEVSVMAELTNKPPTWSPSPIIIDRDHKIWFGNFDGEATPCFYHLDPSTKELTAYPFPEKPRPTGYPTISDWYETEDGMFWIASTLGLFSFEKRTQKWNHWKNDPQDESSLSANVVFSVHPDPRAPKRFIWVGTNGGGLNCLDVKQNIFKRFTIEDGLPNNVIYAIQFDDANNLWASTNNGIFLFNPLTLESRSFSEKDGLIGNEFNRYEYSKSADGMLYFGGVNGTTFFDPKDFFHSSPPSPTTINQIRVANEPIVFGQESGATYFLEQPIELTKSITFRHDVQMITIGFATLDLTSPSKNEFKYKLEGFNEEWIDGGTIPEATYTNLKPGKYTFLVKGRNSNNVWSSNPAAIEIIILPAWWATWWFRLFMFSMVGFLLYSFYQYRLRQLLKVERLRNRIAQDLHDEIGSTLSSISLYSAVMQNSSDNLSPQTRDILTKIINSTSQVMEAMNDIVWAIKSSNDSLKEVVHRMRAFSAQMTEQQDIRLSFQVDPQVEELTFEMIRRKNIYLIFKEAVNNAVKYSQCDMLTVRLQKDGHLFIMSILDNGSGFDLQNPSSGKKVFGGNGLKGMQSRAKEIGATYEINSVIGQGTEVKLAINI